MIDISISLCSDKQTFFLYITSSDGASYDFPLFVFVLWCYNRIQLMVYGRILYNNIKEYTPKWFPTIPYSQTTKPVFGNFKLTQVVSPKSCRDGTRSHL